MYLWKITISTSKIFNLLNCLFIELVMFKSLLALISNLKYLHARLKSCSTLQLTQSSATNFWLPQPNLDFLFPSHPKAQFCPKSFNTPSLTHYMCAQSQTHYYILLHAPPSCCQTWLHHVLLVFDVYVFSFSPLRIPSLVLHLHVGTNKKKKSHY